MNGYFYRGSNSAIFASIIVIFLLFFFWGGGGGGGGGGRRRGHLLGASGKSLEGRFFPLRVMRTLEGFPCPEMQTETLKGCLPL